MAASIWSRVESEEDEREERKRGERQKGFVADGKESNNDRGGDEGETKRRKRRGDVPLGNVVRR